MFTWCVAESFRGFCTKGLWRLGTAAERIACEALRKITRSTFRPLIGRSAQGLSNEEVAAALDMPPAEEMLDVERAKELALYNNSFVWCTLKSDGVWMRHAGDAIRRVLYACHSSLLAKEDMDVDGLVCVIRHHSLAVKTACKAYLKHCIGQRCELGSRVLAAAHSTCVISVSDSDESVHLTDLAGRHTCEVCNASFRTRQQLGLHRARAQKLMALHTSAAVGTMCQVCIKEHWPLNRLQAHLKKSLSCRQVYFHADLDAEVDTTKYSSDPCGAWRPVGVAEGPQPFRQPSTQLGGC